MTSESEVGPETLYDAGMRVRRKVLGDAHVDRALSRTTALDARFQKLITESAWGTVWSGDQFDLRTRSLVTLAILAALGRTEELALHLRATRKTGATPEDGAEMLMHVSIYAGVPAANTAFALARAEFAEFPPIASNERSSTEPGQSG